MTSSIESRERVSLRAGHAAGFTLLEVLAAVLVLGLLYTVLATAAMRGLRSEGIDRRRAEAALIADAELGKLEANMATGIPPPVGGAEEERPPYTIRVEVVPEDVISLLPADVQRQIAAEAQASGSESLLLDPRGQSRLQRVDLSVEWEEAGELYQVVRTTHTFDPATVAHLLQTEDTSVEGLEGFGSAEGESGEGAASEGAGGTSPRSRTSGGRLVQPDVTGAP